MGKALAEVGAFLVAGNVAHACGSLRMARDYDIMCFAGQPAWDVPAVNQNAGMSELISRGKRSEGQEMDDEMTQDMLDEMDELAYDVLMCLRTGIVVSVASEYRLCAYLEGYDLSVMQHCPNLRELTEYFLAHGIDGAWNIGNMLIG